MVVSNRCIGLNLLNHIRQKKIFDNLSIEFNQIYELDELIQHKYYREGYNKCSWYVTLKLDKNTYTSIGSRKKGSILEIIKQAEKYIYSRILN